MHIDSHTNITPRTISGRLIIALFLTLAFIVLEAGGGVLANSLALLTDATHNLADALALGLTWWALRLSMRPSNEARTFGYHRAGILVALFNAGVLIGISLFIAFEAVKRLYAPQQVQEQIVILFGAIGLILNTGIAWSLHQASRHDASVRSAFIHLAGDALAATGVILSGAGAALFGWFWLDSAASVLIAILIVLSAWDIVREAADILLEGTPRGVDIGAMVRDMSNIGGVRGVHDLHVWSISSNLRALSAHILTDDITIAQGAEIQQNINMLLTTRYGIGHSALQLECVGCEPDLLYCELSPSPNLTANRE